MSDGLGEIALDQVGSWLPSVGPWGLVTIFFLLIFSGRLVPGREMRYWRDAFFEEQRQKRELLKTGIVTRNVLAALPEAAESAGEDL